MISLCRTLSYHIFYSFLKHRWQPIELISRPKMGQDVRFENTAHAETDLEHSTVTNRKVRLTLRERLLWGGKDL